MTLREVDSAVPHDGGMSRHFLPWICLYEAGEIATLTAFNINDFQYPFSWEAECVVTARRDHKFVAGFHPARRCVRSSVDGRSANATSGCSLVSELG